MLCAGNPVTTQQRTHSEMAAAVLAEYARACPRAPPRDPRHTRCTDACTMWHSRKHKACVCVATRLVHMCGDECTLEGRPSEDGDTRVCTLTHLVLDRQVYLQAPAFKDSVPVFHWANVRVRRNGPRKACRAQPLSVGKVTEATRACLAPRDAARAPTVANAAKKLRRRLSFCDIAACVHAANAPRPTHSVSMLAATAALARDIHAFLTAHTAVKCGTIDVRVAVVLTLMSVGWRVEGVALFPRVPFVANNIPKPSQMHSIPRIQCRPISVGVRALKRYQLTQAGLPILNRAMVLSQDTRDALYACETARPAAAHG